MVVRVWDVESEKELKNLPCSAEFFPNKPRNHGVHVGEVHFAPDGTWALFSGVHTVDTKGFQAELSHEVWIIDLGSGKKARRLAETGKDRGMAPNFTSSTFFVSPDGRRILAHSDHVFDNRVWVWDPKSGAVVQHFDGDRGVVNCPAVSANGRRVLSVGSDEKPIGMGPLMGPGPGRSNKRVLRLWNLETGKDIRSLGGPRDWIKDVAISPDGRSGLSIEGGNLAGDIVRVWNLESGDQRHSWEVDHNLTEHPVFYFDGRRALSTPAGDRRPALMGPAMMRGMAAAGKDLCLWDVQSGKKLAIFSGHTDSAYGLAVSLDGRQFLSGSADGTVRLWDIPK
jgi:WD40 repeat protein